MDDDQEYERFDVDNDFEGGEWIEDEFYYKNKRRKKGQSRDDAIYGVFGEDSDDDGGGGGRRQKGRGDRHAADFTKPVGFVGGGVIKQGIDDDDDDEEENAAMEMEEEEEDEGGSAGLGLGARPSFAAAGGGGGGLGFSGGGGGGGLGFAPNAGLELGHPQANNDDDEEELLPTAFGRRMKQAAERRRQEQEARRGAGGGLGSAQKGSLHGSTAASMGDGVKPKGDVGTFEVHTKGIGAKLLSKMGWTPGGGLGRDGKGIAKPLEAKLRPKGMGMGFGDRREPQLAPEIKKDAEVEDGKKKGGKGASKASAVDVAREAKMWKKKQSEARGRRTFRTAEEVLQDEEERGGGGAPVERQTVIDMRGKHARVVTDLEHLNAADEDEEAEDGGAGAIPMPELQHNVRLLVDMAEADIQKLDARLRQGQDTRAILARERERLATEAALAAEAAQTLEEILEAVHAVSGAAAQSLDLPALRAAYSDIQARHREEYRAHNLSALALAAVLPRLAAALGNDWSPLDDPSGPAAEFMAWRPLLEHENTKRAHAHQTIADTSSAHAYSADFLSVSAASDPYVRLVCELLLPPLRKDIANRWDPRCDASMERFVEIWEPALPVPALGYLLQHLVLPRLRMAVNDWDPLKDPIAPHTWLHPWLPHLGQHMTELWPVLRFKFSTALAQWHPADASALSILAPWRRVFETREWDQLIARAIVPKLAAALSEFIVNPADQNLDAFEWTMAWANVMSPRQMSTLLDAHFFPKWHTVLRHWLSSSPDYDEVTRWYLGWKALFPEEVLDTQAVRAQMAVALNAMNSAVEGKPLEPTWTAPSSAAAGMAAQHTDTANGHHPASYDEAYGAPHVHPSAAAIAAERAAEELTLRDLVGRFAEEVGIQFVPKAGRMHEGLQVFQFGKVACVVDSAHELIRIQIRDDSGSGWRWDATSMEGLLQEHERREAGNAKKR